MAELEYTVDSNGVITFTSDIEEGTDLSTDISGLVLIKHGAKAESEPLNDNFTYLNIKTDQLNNNIIAIGNSVVATAQSTVNTMLNNQFYALEKIDGSSAQGAKTLAANKAYSIIPTAAMTFNPQAITDNTKFYQILVQLKLTNTDYISSSSLGTGVKFFGGETPSFSTGYYDIIYEYNNAESKWYCAAIYKGAI